MAVPFGWEGWFTLGCLAVMFVVLVREWMPADFALVATLGVLMAAQIVTTSEGLEGFSSSSVLTVAILYVVAAGINSTGALDHIFGKVLGNPKSLTVAQLRLMVPIVLASAFLNNTPLCAIMIPLVQRWARRIKQPVSQLMIPLSFASILGGTITLIGTSTNLVVAGKFSAQFPGQSIGLFDIGAVGVPAAMTGMVYILLFAPMLLPGFEELERRSRKALGLDVSETSSNPSFANTGEESAPSVPGQRSNFTVSCIVTPYSPAVGKAVDEAGLRGLNGLFLVSVQRGQRMHNAVGPEFVINEDDVLFFTGIVDHFGEFCIRHAFELVTTDLEDDDDVVSLDSSSSEHMSPARPSQQHLRDRLLEPQSVRLEPLGWDIESGATVASVASVRAAEADAAKKGVPTRERVVSDRRYTFRERITQVVVRSGSTLEGKTAKECRFRKRYDAAILSLYRAGEQLSVRGNLGRIPLKVGDVLLLVTGNDFDWSVPEIERDLKPFLAEEAALVEASPVRQLQAVSQQELEREFLIPMRVNENTQLRGARSLVGQTVESAGLRGLPGLFLVAVEHSDRSVEHVVGPEMVLAANDMLWFAGEREAVATLRRIPGLHPPDTQAQKLKVQPVQRRLVECVVSMRSHLVGKTVRESKFRTQYEAAIIAVHRQGRRVLSKIGDIDLRAGDVLILDTGPNFVQRYRDNPNFLLVTEIDDSSPPHFDKFYIALVSVIIMLVVYVVFSDYISLIVPAIFVSGIMLVKGILTPERARRAVSWDVIVTIAAAFGLSNALSKSGVASAIGNALVDLAALTGTGYVGVLTARILEGMVPELEDLQERGLYGADEIREIVKRRRDFEYKLQRRAPRKEDYLRYAEYEIALDKLRKKRRKRRGIRKSGPGDSSGHRRVNFVFERAVRRFKGDIMIWHRAIDYCLESKDFGVATKRLGEVLKLHPREVDFWIKAARFHFEANGDTATARSLLQTGLRLNKDRPTLWAEYLRLEALHAYQIRQRRLVLGIDEETDENDQGDSGADDEDADDEEKQAIRAREAARRELLFKGKVLEIVYKQAVRALPGSSELREALAKALQPFLDDSLLHEAAANLTHKIWEEATSGPTALEDPRARAKCWANRIEFELRQDPNPDVWAHAKRLKAELEETPGPEMADAYVNFLIDHRDELEDGAPPPTKRRARGAGKASSAASASAAAREVLDMQALDLSEETLVRIADIDPSDKELLAQCMKRLPAESLPLIRRQMRGVPAEDLKSQWALVQRACNHFVSKRLKMGDAMLRDEVQEIYLTYLNSCVTSKSMSTLEAIEAFERAIRWFYEHGRIEGGDAYMRVSSLISGLLDWVATSRRLDLVEQVVQRLHKAAVPPVLPVAVHERILSLYDELGATPTAMRKILTQATLEHSGCEDLWVRFVEFEREHGDLASERAAIIRASGHVPDLAAVLDSRADRKNK
ncbi:U3 small nucleolar RNA-associated protein 6 [Hondaea fermentalgiana]|uniref:U3 small nucleolar RNA-associated protein 6 n=1 Tax=Hondaea fermentalgiana TaxID=2315210 RepID=A0A2R5GJ74_9STRA|nr:U3 small nucleolar RNA-associated protein 6 [Hondaea fermentalgiana]|eukprot:GBG28341.1 U3 small nucleolar RNA-associated protein 6 [Hondaea fermentalgiana]